MKREREIGVKDTSWLSTFEPGIKKGRGGVVARWYGQTSLVPVPAAWSRRVTQALKVRTRQESKPDRKVQVRIHTSDPQSVNLGPGTIASARNVSKMQIFRS